MEQSQSSAGRAWYRLRRNRIAWGSGAIVVLLIIAAFVGPWLAPFEPGAISPEVMSPPSSANPLGTDDLGRDTFSQLIWGVRASLTVGLLSALSTTLIGLLVGSIAGYFGGRLDAIVMRISEIFQVMPTFILAAVIVAFAGAGFFRVVAVIALLSWPQTARLARGEVIRVKQLEFVDAVRCLGRTEWSILWREVLPNAIPPVLAVGTLIIGQAILLEAGLAFFGLTTPEVPSWGNMLNVGQRFVYEAWWLSVFPGLAILVTVLAFNLFGDSVSAAFNPRGREHA